MPSATQNGTADRSHFRVVQNFKADWCPSSLTLYESERTGMRVVVVDQKGPKVHGYFALATEIHDDSGAPHTLEHLIFMGSKSYKYKGILDKLATRAYSNTNAWTATDHTAYTLDSAGWAGFAQILPVYLEHVLLPTLTDAACYTEVHHVDGEGNDAGVVYSEMQGTQNTQMDLMDLAGRRRLYPDEFGFRFETGGLMERLRVLTADRIRQFHKDMYQPKNLCLVLIGEVDQPNLLQILDVFEDSILDDVPSLNDPFTRPWTDKGHVPSLQASMTEVVEFPEADESTGEIQIGYFGPPYEDEVLGLALDAFLLYVCGSSVSLLDNTIVEKEQLASGIYYSTDIRPDTVIWFTLSGVETSKLQSVADRFFTVMNEASEKTIDMAYMHDCLHRFKRQLLFAAENSAKTFADSIISDHLFGPRDGSSLYKMRHLRDLDSLIEWSENDWRSFWKKWFTNAHHLTVLGKPSSEMATRLEEAEKQRVEEQKTRLGSDGLKELADKLDAAKAENDRDIPEHILKDFTIPSTDSIHFIPTITARSGLAKKMGHDSSNPIQKIVDADENGLNTFIHFEHIPSNFVRLNIILGTHGIPIELRPLLPIYLMNFFETAVTRDGKSLDFESVVTKLEQDTVGYDIGMGRSIGNSEMLHINLQVEQAKYSTAIAWLRDLLYTPIFEQERLASHFSKLLADIPEAKRSGSSMSFAVSSLLHLSRESTVRAQNVLVKALYLPRVFMQLKTEPEAVIAKFQQIRDILTRPQNFRIFVSANLESLPNPVSAWEGLFPTSPPTNLELNPLDDRKKLLAPESQPFGSAQYVVPMATLDSSFAHATSKGPSSFDAPELPALSVALAYLEAVEGPLWITVRGAGLAYGVNFVRDLELGTLAFDVYRAPDAHRAFAASRDVVSKFATGVEPLDDLALEGAVSSIVVQFANEQPSMASAANIGFVNEVIKRIGKDWGTKFMAKVRNVTKEDVKKVLHDVVLPVFQGQSANIVMTCAKALEEKIAKGFEADGFQVKVKSLAEFKDEYGLEGVEEVPIEEEDDDDDEEGDDDDDKEDA